jgi:hypothetical protein
MSTVYDGGLKAHVTFDSNNRPRHVRHSQEHWESAERVPRLAAGEYLQAMAGSLELPAAQLQTLNKAVSFLEPREQGVEYHLSEEKHLFDAVTVGYAQTYLNVPVWRKGVAVTIKQAPNRVIEATRNIEEDIRGKLPDATSIKTLQTRFRHLTMNQLAIKAGVHEPGEVQDDDAAFVLGLFGMKPPAPAPAAAGAKRSAHDHRGTRLMSGKFFIYKYHPNKRYGGKPGSGADNSAETTNGKTDGQVNGHVAEEGRTIPMPPLPPVSPAVNPGQSYLCAELIFTSDAPGFHGLVWLVLVEVETSSILYMECMTCGINGLVFRRDPSVKTGNLAITAADGNAVLNPLRDDVTLPALDGPIAGTQGLSGTFVTISELTIAHADPDIAPPAQGPGLGFDYDVRTDNFGAVNAYYHMTELFRTIESLGFPRTTYFDGTTFPIPIDHRALGTIINAHWSPNGSGGTDHMCFALGDTTNTAEPLARAVDPWVHWHEMGGHGTLGDHVGGGTFGFAHSAGDGLAALQMDPDSALRALPDRFRYAPFRPQITRRFDRPVATWAWGSVNDDSNYGSEEILATCHFRVYRSIGGDHSDLARRQFASRMMTYLILRGIGGLTSGTNPSTPEAWCEALMATDLLDWTTEGLSGGAYNKVIRWSFEQQGAYQPPGAPTPVTTPGAPPEVDVYIDDGRAGEYGFQPVHWHNLAIWNRNSVGGTAHQNANEGADNYLYGKIKNRGTATANNVTVRAFHSRPGAGLTWPNDFVEMSPPGGISVSGVPAGSAGEVTVGPFTWQPSINAFGHDCVLMIASSAGDPSNIDNFTSGETIAEWRLVPNDNNIGQRNVAVVPGGGGREALMKALDGAPFWAGNPFDRVARMALKVTMPAVLADKGWCLEPHIEGGKFKLKPGEKRKVTLKLKKGKSFSADEIRNANDRDIHVDLSGNDMLIGGMTYRLDPELEHVSGGRPRGKDCETTAQSLLASLDGPSEQKVKKVSVTKVTLEIELGDDDDRERE